MLEQPVAPVPDPVAWALFFAHLAETADVAGAAAVAGVSVQTVRHWRRAHSDFAQSWEEALAAAREALELQMLSRALQGDRRTLYYGGKPVGEQIDYNDSLAMFFLRAHQPHIYGNTAARTTRPAVDVAAAQAEIERRLDNLAARLAAQEKPSA